MKIEGDQTGTITITIMMIKEEMIDLHTKTETEVADIILTAINVLMEIDQMEEIDHMEKNHMEIDHMETDHMEIDQMKIDKMEIG